MPEADLYLRVHLDLISEQGGYRSTIIPFFVFLLVAMFVEFSLFCIFVSVWSSGRSVRFQGNQQQFQHSSISCNDWDFGHSYESDFECHGRIRQDVWSRCDYRDYFSVETLPLTES